MAAKYIFVLRSRSTAVFFVTSLGRGASGIEPSCGISEGEETAGESCADPKMYEMKEWSSRPHTPCEPAGSRVYVRISLRTSCRYLLYFSKDEH